MLRLVLVMQSIKMASQLCFSNFFFFLLLGIIRYILESASFELFFKFVELRNFDVASDAFSTFKVRSEFSPFNSHHLSYWL